MSTYGGGWTLVVKANNGDSVSFYSNHTILTRGNTLNPTTQNSTAAGDYVGEAFSRLVGDEILLRDCVGPNNGRGRYLMDGTLADFIEYAKRPTFDGTEQCGLLALDTQFSGATLGDAPRTHIGLACEDDSDTSWVPDDDGTVISWYDSAGDASNSFAHTVGITKVGTDGGDDVQNGANTSRPACVMDFWR